MNKQQRAEFRGLSKDSTPTGIAILHDWLQENCPEMLPKYYMEHNIYLILSHVLYLTRQHAPEKRHAPEKKQPTIMQEIKVGAFCSGRRVFVSLQKCTNWWWRIAIRQDAKPGSIWRKAQKEVKSILRDKKEMKPNPEFDEFCRLLEQPC